ncbi:hypothetical protein Tco_1370084 [Tanacetum coccineum]
MNSITMMSFEELKLGCPYLEKKSKPAPAKPQEKKRKPVSEPSEVSPLAKRAKAGKVVKKRTVKSSKQLVDEFVDEGVPAAKPGLKTQRRRYCKRETDTGKLQPLTEVPGKGKEKTYSRTICNQRAMKSIHPFFMLNFGLTGSDTGVMMKKSPSVVRRWAQDEGQEETDPGKLD